MVVMRGQGAGGGAGDVLLQSSAPWLVQLASPQWAHSQELCQPLAGCVFGFDCMARGHTRLRHATDQVPSCTTHAVATPTSQVWRSCACCAVLYRPSRSLPGMVRRPLSLRRMVRLVGKEDRAHRLQRQAGVEASPPAQRQVRWGLGRARRGACCLGSTTMRRAEGWGVQCLVLGGKGNLNWNLNIIYMPRQIPALCTPSPSPCSCPAPPSPPTTLPRPLDH